LGASSNNIVLENLDYPTKETPKKIKTKHKDNYKLVLTTAESPKKQYFASHSLQKISKENISLDFDSTAKAARIASAQNVVENAENELALANDNLNEINRNQFEYKNIVESSKWPYLMVSEYDPDKFQDAVANATKILIEKQEQVRQALVDLTFAMCE